MRRFFVYTAFFIAVVALQLKALSLSRLEHAQKASAASTHRAWQDGVLAHVNKADSRAEILEPQIQTGTGDYGPARTRQNPHTSTLPSKNRTCI